MSFNSPAPGSCAQRASAEQSRTHRGTLPSVRSQEVISDPRQEEEVARQLLGMDRGRPGTARPPPQQQQPGMPILDTGHCRPPNNLLISERYSHPPGLNQLTSALPRGPRKEMKQLVKCGGCGAGPAIYSRPCMRGSGSKEDPPRR